MEESSSREASGQMAMDAAKGAYEAVLKMYDTPTWKPHRGAWTGHFIPGFAFSLLGLWWMYNTVVTFAKRVRRKASGIHIPKDAPIISYGGRPLCFWPTTNIVDTCDSENNADGEAHEGVMPWSAFGEPFAIILLSAAGGYVEALKAHFRLNDMEHTTMYAGFIIAAIISIISTRTPAARAAVPHGTEALLFAIAFLSESVLVAGHTMVDLSIYMPPFWAHQLMAVAGILSFIALVTYAFQPFNLGIVVFGSIATTLQGLWWIESAFFFFEPFKWRPHTKLVLEFFCWTLVVLATGMAIAFFVCGTRAYGSKTEAQYSTLELGASRRPAVSGEKKRYERFDVPASGN